MSVVIKMQICNEFMVVRLPVSRTNICAIGGSHV